MNKFLNFCANYFGILASIGLLVGLAGGDLFLFMKPFVVIGLMIILTLSLLKIDFANILHKVKNPFWIFYFSFLKLIIFPTLMFFLALAFPETYRPGIILLSVAPAAIASPALLMIFKGDINLGLLVSLFTNIISPLLIPWVLFFTLGKTITIDVSSMFIFLLWIIAIPFLISYLLKRFTTNLVKKINKSSKGITAIVFFLFSVSVISPHSHIILSDITNSLSILALILILSFFLHLFGVLVAIKYNKKMIVTSIIFMAYFNNGIVVVLAQQYFDSTTVLITLLYEIPWNMGLIALQRIFCKNEIQSI